MPVLQTIRKQFIKYLTDHNRFDAHLKWLKTNRAGIVPDFDWLKQLEYYKVADYYDRLSEAIVISTTRALAAVSFSASAQLIFPPRALQSSISRASIHRLTFTMPVAIGSLGVARWRSSRS